MSCVLLCHCHVALSFSDNTMPSPPVPATKAMTLALYYSIIHCSPFFFLSTIFLLLFFFIHTCLSPLLPFHSFFLPRSVFIFYFTFTGSAPCKPLYTPNTLHKLFVAPYQQMPSFPNGHVDDGYGRKRRIINPGRVF